jgi:L-lactate utilization protein LutB
MLATFILEPSSTGKRQAYARALVMPKVRPFSDLADFRTRLKSIRQTAVAGLESLDHALVETLHAVPDVEVVVADDSQQAVDAVRRACGPGNTVAINHSSVVIQEVAPALEAAGVHVVDSYAGEFPVSENRFTEYYDLPRATFDHLVESFSTSDLGRLRNRSVEASGVKDFVALLGVNAVSADDGSTFFLQHSENIAEAFQQARRIMLLAAVDKIVSSREDARLQAVGMGTFGWEVRLPGLGRSSGTARLEELPWLPASGAHRDVTVIIMDNGRKRLLEGPYRDLLLCMGCRACIRSCPTQQFMAAKNEWSPKEYLYFFVQGRSPSVDLCLNCGICQVECPLDIDLPGMMMGARCDRRLRRSVARDSLSDLERLGRWGSRAPGLVNFALGNPVSRWVGDRAMGISKDAPLPVFHGDTLARWLRARDGRKER